MFAPPRTKPAEQRAALAADPSPGGIARLQTSSQALPAYLAFAREGPRPPPFVQAYGAAGGDAAAEAEADRIAGQLTTGAAGATGAVPVPTPVGAGPPAPPPVRDALGGGGAPLDPGIRSLYESRLGHDLADVRIHTGPRADHAAASLGALAFTHGRDIAFRDGQFAPSGGAGGALLAHELVHVVQQASAPRLQLKEDPDLGPKSKPAPGVTRRFSITIDSILDADQLLAAFNTQFRAAMGIVEERKWKWLNPPSEVTAADVAKGYVLVTVTDDSVRPATPAEQKRRTEYFKGLPAEDRSAINAEADREFWQKTNYDKDKKLGTSPDDKRMAETWKSIRDELLRKRLAIDVLPPQVRAFLFDEQALQSVSPADFEKVLRIASKVAGMTAAELAEYKGRTTGATTDWNAFDTGINAFLDERKERGERAAERLPIETRLFGLDTLYKHYRDYLSGLKTTSFLASSHTAMGAGGAMGSMPSQNKRYEELIAELDAAGFPGGIDAFGNYLKSYRHMFELESRSVATIMLDRYEHSLHEATKKWIARAPDATLTLSQIAEHKDAVAKMRGIIAANQGLVYDLPDLLNASLATQNIAPGSIYDKIIRDHVSDTHLEKLFTQLMLGIVAVAAGLLTAGGGTAAVLAGGAAFGIGAFQAYEEFEKYQLLSTAHDAGLALDAPSIAWVVVGVVGAVFDAAALTAALKASPMLRSAIGAFNAGSEADDAVKFAAKVDKLADVETRIGKQIVKAAQEEAKTRAAWRAIGRPTGVLYSSLVPLAPEFGQFVFAVYLSMKNGLRRLDLFVKSREAIELIGDVGKLGPEDLAKLKTAYLQAVKEAETIAAQGKKLGLADDEILRFMEMRASNGMSVAELEGKMASVIGGTGTIPRDAWSGTVIKLLGPEPAGMKLAHRHHILMLNAWSGESRELVREGQKILRSYNIDPVMGIENLVWAPRIEGVHSIETVRALVKELKTGQEAGISRNMIVDILNKYGKIAAKTGAPLEP